MLPKATATAMVLCSLSTGFCAVSLDYTVEGTMQHHQALPGRPAVSRMALFKVQVEGCQYVVTVRMATTPAEPRFVVRYDGTDLLYYVEDPKEHSKTAGSIENCQVPQTLFPLGNEYAWLALASSCYFTSVTNGSVLSFQAAQSPSGRRARINVPAAVHLSLLYPYLPRAIDYVNIGMVFFDYNDTLRTNAFPGTGEIDAEFRAESFTNHSGLWLPHTFTFRRFFFAPVSNGNTKRLCASEVVGIITNTLLGSGGISQSPLPKGNMYPTTLKWRTQ